MILSTGVPMSLIPGCYLFRSTSNNRYMWRIYKTTDLTDYYALNNNKVYAPQTEDYSITANIVDTTINPNDVIDYIILMPGYKLIAYEHSNATGSTYTYDNTSGSSVLYMKTNFWWGMSFARLYFNGNHLA